MKNIGKYFVVLLLLLQMSCIKELNPKDYIHYVLADHNGFLQQCKEHQLIYMPVEFMALNSLRKINPSEQELEEEKNTYKSASNFNLRIYSNNNNQDRIPKVAILQMDDQSITSMSMEEETTNHLVDYKSYIIAFPIENSKLNKDFNIRVDMDQEPLVFQYHIQKMNRVLLSLNPKS